MPLRLMAIFLLALATACAAPGRMSPPAALAYAPPASPVVEYEVGDTARIEIQAAGQSFAVNANVRERWRMEMGPSPAGVRVTASLVDLDGTLTNPLTRPQTADESAVSGPLVFTLDPRGRATVEVVPRVAPAVAQFLSGAGTAHSFFPRLPGRAAGPADVWTDTVSYEVEESGAVTRNRSVTTYTVVGDSLVAGKRYLLVRTAGTTEQSSAGKLAGTDFHQQAAGTTSGHFLWDRGAGLLHSLEYRSELTGSMSVPIAPEPLAVRVTSTIRQRRVAP
jgi:hypothetical protein